MRKAFTIIELLVVVSIIALLVGILLPAIGKARDQARASLSHANLRNLAVAHGAYAAEWNDRQLTFVVDNISTYGSGFDDAFGPSGYWGAHGGRDDGGKHPPVVGGWGRARDGAYTWIAADTTEHCTHAAITTPLVFEGCSGYVDYFGSFRIINAAQFNTYVSGRFYDEVFYAPKDTIVRDAAGACFEIPDQFAYCAHVQNTEWALQAAWSSYVLSPAAMFDPRVLARHDDDGGGFTDPWSVPAGFRSPAFAQCLYPALKTHVLEHHWLQNNPAAAMCNPGFASGHYGEPPCDPYYFNHAWESSPGTLFYDGHVEAVGVRRTMRADGCARVQSGDDDAGLWSRDTPWGEDGYLIEHGYDQAATSFHVLTTEGIRGRDTTAE